MMWIGYSAMWLSVACTVVFAINATGSARPLWAMIIPLFVSLSVKEKKSPAPPKEENDDDIR